MASPESQLDDAELLQRLSNPTLAGQAFDELYSRHATDLLAYARCRFSHLADDLCQAAWLEAIHRHWQAGDAVRAWLFRVEPRSMAHSRRREGLRRAASFAVAAAVMIAIGAISGT